MSPPSGCSLSRPATLVGPSTQRFLELHLSAILIICQFYDRRMYRVVLRRSLLRETFNDFDAATEPAHHRDRH